jgi:hypothetical protein
MHKSSFIPMVLGYIPGSEGYIPLFLQGTIVLGTVVIHLTFYRFKTVDEEFVQMWSLYR